MANSIVPPTHYATAAAAVDVATSVPARSQRAVSTDRSHELVGREGFEPVRHRRLRDERAGHVRQVQHPEGKSVRGLDGTHADADDTAGQVMARTQNATATTAPTRNVQAATGIARSRSAFPPVMSVAAAIAVDVGPKPAQSSPIPGVTLPELVAPRLSMAAPNTQLGAARLDQRLAAAAPAAADLRRQAPGLYTIRPITTAKLTSSTRETANSRDMSRRAATDPGPSVSKSATTRFARGAR